MSLPSQKRPVGRRKKVSPYGGLVAEALGARLITRLPASVMESPKLNIRVQPGAPPAAGPGQSADSTVAYEQRRRKRRGSIAEENEEAIDM